MVMTTTRAKRVTPSLAICLLAAAALVPAGAGCRKRLRGIDCPGQTLLDKGRSVLQEADGVEGVVSPVPVPWASKSEPIGFAIELTNFSDRSLRLELDSIELRDPLGRLLKPLPPDRLLRAFGAEPVKDSRVRRVAYRRYFVRRHYYPRRWLRPYWCGWGYGRPRYDVRVVGGWGFGGMYYDDTYAEARRIARFLSELLTDQTIAPQHVATGQVVFPYRLRSDDQVTVLIHIPQPDAAPSPATPNHDPEGVASDETAAVEPTPSVTTLTFRFEES